MVDHEGAVFWERTGFTRRVPAKEDFSLQTSLDLKELVVIYLNGYSAWFNDDKGIPVQSVNAVVISETFGQEICTVKSNGEIEPVRLRQDFFALLPDTGITIKQVNGVVTVFDKNNAEVKVSPSNPIPVPPRRDNKANENK